MDKKNIDELFREKFKTFREVPDEKVWTDIERSLDKKRKRRVIPIWWSLGGVAALLAIGFFAFYAANEPSNETPIITDTDQIDSQETKQDDPSIITNTENINSRDAEQDEPSILTNIQTIRIQDSKQDEPDTTEKQNQKDALQIPEITEDALASGADDENLNKNTETHTDPKANTNALPNKLLDADVAGVDGTSQKDGIKMDSGNKKDSGNRSPEKTKLATNKSESHSTDGIEDFDTKGNNPALNKDKTKVLSEGNSVAVAVTDTDTSENANTSKADDKIKTGDGIVTSQEAPNMVSEASDKAIAQNDQNEKGNLVNDTISKNKKKSIFEVLETQNEDGELAEASESRWSAGANVAPVYFDAMGEGSPIDPGFSPNAKSGSTNMSYGLSIAYAVTKKLSVRSGIHKAEYGYDTNDVGFSPTLDASSNGRFQNIDYVGGSENLALNSTASDAASPEDFTSEVNSLNTTRDGNVSQQFGYIEVPLELDYALLDSRFGVNLVGGISSLFLTNNSITLSSEELTTEIGEARNLNDVNFSTNIGFGVNYKFTPKIQLNIEPVFKYQLNTFSNVAGDFRPFSIGVYSGLNFKF